MTESKRKSLKTKQVETKTKLEVEKVSSKPNTTNKENTQSSQTNNFSLIARPVTSNKSLLRPSNDSENNFRPNVKVYKISSKTDFVSNSQPTESLIAQPRKLKKATNNEETSLQRSNIY